MIHEVSGDILLSQAAAIAHGVAPADLFQHGLASSLRQQWPAMADDFQEWCHQTDPKPGNVWIWNGSEDLRILCLLTQQTSSANHGHRAGQAHIEYVNRVLKRLRQVVEQEAIASLALPRLATGVGALEWSEVKPFVEHYLGDLPIPVYLYEQYRVGVAAEEPDESLAEADCVQTDSTSIP